jgi:hypothetical protein
LGRLPAPICFSCAAFFSIGHLLASELAGLVAAQSGHVHDLLAHRLDGSIVLLRGANNTKTLITESLGSDSPILIPSPTLAAGKA